MIYVIERDRLIELDFYIFYSFYDIEYTDSEFTVVESFYGYEKELIDNKLYNIKINKDSFIAYDCIKDNLDYLFFS